MGQSSSAEQVSPEQREAESVAASTGALPNLKKAFSVLSDPQTHSIPIHSLQVILLLVPHVNFFFLLIFAQFTFCWHCLNHLQLGF